MKLCKRCSEYHQTRRLRIAAAKVVAKAESSALAIADLKRRRASTVTMDDRRASPYTPHPTPVAPVPKTTTTPSSSAPELQTLPNLQDYSTPEIRAAPRLLTPIVPSQEQEQSRAEAFDYYRHDKMHTFVDALDKLTIEVCDTCNESSFDMNIRQVCGRDICKCCFAESKKKNFTIHCFFSNNDMDPDIYPRHMLYLSYIEQILLTLTHPVTNVWRVAGGQWKGGSVHCISFFQDPSALFTQIPCLPADLKVVIIKKRGQTLANHAEFKVDVDRLQRWMSFLLANNKWYRHKVTVNLDAINQLRLLGHRLQESLEIDSEDFQEGGERDLGPGIDDEEREDIVDEYGFIHTGVLRTRINVNERATLEQLLALCPIASQASQNRMYHSRVYFTAS